VKEKKNHKWSGVEIKTQLVNFKNESDHRRTQKKDKKTTVDYKRRCSQEGEAENLVEPWSKREGRKKRGKQ